MFHLHVHWGLSTGKLKKQWILAQSAQKYNIIDAKSRIQNMGQKQKIHAEANAENTSGPHDVGWPSAAPHRMVAAATMW